MPDATDADKDRAISPPEERSRGNSAHRQQHVPDIFLSEHLVKSNT